MKTKYPGSNTDGFETGKDRAVGIALALLVQYYDTHGVPYSEVSHRPDGKYLCLTTNPPAEDLKIDVLYSR
jgi:hypothetical protein